VQDQLFRFLETAEFSRTGDAATRSADVRVLAGLDGDPEAAVREGRLRVDLLARLDVVRIAIPPLRARRTDLPLLALRVVDEVAARLECAPLTLAPSALRVLARYDFPNDNADELAGDVEELYATLGAGANVSSRDLPAKFVQGDPSTSEHYSEAVRAFKAQIITNAVHEAGGSRVRAAERLGLHPSNLSRMVRDLDLDEVL